MAKSIITSPPKAGKNVTSGKNAKKAPTGQPPAAPATTEPGYVTVRADAKRVTLGLGDLGEAAIRDVAEQLAQEKFKAAQVEIGISDDAPLTPAARAPFWALYRALAGEAHRPVAIRVGDKAFARPPDWAAAALANAADDPAGQCRALDFAADALALAYKPADRDVYLDAVLAKLRERGYASQYCEGVRRNLRQRLRQHEQQSGGVKAAPAGSGGGAAYDLARLFLNDRYPAAGGAPEADAYDPGSQPAHPKYGLRYYGEPFYRRRAASWAEAAAEDVRLELTSYLQGVAPDRAGVRHVADVLVNVKALCATRLDGTPPLPFDLGGSNRRMLALRNGLLDLTALARGKKPKLLPHDPDWFSTSALPYEFDPGADCPQFKKFLGQILDAHPKTLEPLAEGDNRVAVVQEFMGYSLLPDNRFQTFGIFTGRGRNGKGTLLDVWGEALGPENVSSVPLESMAREFGTEPLVGRMLNLAGDMNDIDAAAEGTLKAWTGEDRVTVPRKYRAALQVEPAVKFVYACNKLPWFKDKSDGIWRRLLVVPFNFAPKSPADVDSGLRRKLKKELPGVLNWALAGLARLLAQDGFTQCPVCEAAKREHREACSPVGEFIDNHFTLASGYAGPKAGKKWMTTTTEVKLLVRDYAAKYGERVIAANVVCRELAAMKGVSTRRPTTVSGRTDYGTIFCGVCVGEPKTVIPGELDEFAKKTGLQELASGPAAGPPGGAAAKKAKTTKGPK